MKIKGILTALVLSAVLSAGSAFALSLSEAKQQGLVGESTTGYLAPVKPPPPEVSALIDSVNQQRRAKYQQIAGKNGTSVGAVEALAGKKAIEESSPGHYVQQSSGGWTKK